MSTTKEINDLTIAQIEAKTGASIPLLDRALTRILTWVFSGAFQILYKRLDFAALQMFPQYASTKISTFLGIEFIPLQQLGIKNGTGARKQFSTAVYDIICLVDTDGATVTAGTSLTSQFSAVSFEVIEDTIINSSSINWPPDNPTPQTWQIFRVKSVIDGADGALLLGEELTWDSTPTGLNNDAAFQYATIIEGADDETWEDYRARVLLREQSESQGGSPYDYFLWSTAVNGVSNAYPYTGNPGETNVYIEGPGVTAVSQDLLNNVYSAIQLNDAGLASRRPINDKVSTLSISIKLIDVSIYGLVAPNIEIAKTNIEAAIYEYFINLEPYIEGLSQPPKNNFYRRDNLTTAAFKAAAESGASFSSVGVSATLPVLETILPEGWRYKLGVTTWL